MTGRLGRPESSAGSEDWVDRRDQEDWVDRRLGRLEDWVDRRDQLGRLERSAGPTRVEMKTGSTGVGMTCLKITLI